MDGIFLYGMYLGPLLLLVGLHALRRHRRGVAGARTWTEALESGLTEPTSLHPTASLDECIGSGACVKSCPEEALGIIDGKIFLVNPSACIGHGACEAACPMGAIKLVFGTARRGMEIPRVQPTFETNVPGVYIAGELGGMGLIRKAVEQGKQAAEHISRRPKTAAPYDLVIVGAGPAGMAAALAAAAKGLRYTVLEQEESFGGTTLHYPRGKVVMTAPMDLPIVGKRRMREISKEDLMALWEEVVGTARLDIRFGEYVQAVKQEHGVLAVQTAGATYLAGAVLLAIGRRGTPRKLGVPGEEASKVVYRLVDPEQYRGRRVLVVGGGDSALEAAMALAQEPGTSVTLSYRSNAFGRVKPKNRSSFEAAVQAGRIEQLLSSNVTRIEDDRVLLEQDGQQLERENDAVIVCAGGILPNGFLKEIGIEVEVRHGT